MLHNTGTAASFYSSFTPVSLHCVVFFFLVEGEKRKGGGGGGKPSCSET